MLNPPEVYVHQATDDAPFVQPEAEEPRTIMIEVDGSKVKSPFHFFSYPTIKKLGIALTPIGGLLLCISGLTMMDIFRDLYVFYIPGLAVTLAGSFGISSSKAKRKKLKKGLVVATAVLSLCAIAGALYSMATATQYAVDGVTGKINILMILRIGVAVVVLPVAGMLLGIALDSLCCGRHRPGYSTMVRLVCKADDIELDQLDGVKLHTNKKPHDLSHHQGDRRHNHGNHSPRPHGNHSPRHHGNHSPRHHGNHSPRPHGDRSPRPKRDRSPRSNGEHSPRHNSPQLHSEHAPLTTKPPSPHGHQNGHHERSHHHHHHDQDGHHHNNHHHQQQDNIKTDMKYSGLEHLASMDHSSDHKKVEEHHGWDMVNRM